MNEPEGVSRQAADEAAKILDALAVLSHDIRCDDALPPDELVLPAHKVREVCGAIHHAVGALKRLLHLAQAQAGASLPPGGSLEGGTADD